MIQPIAIKSGKPCGFRKEPALTGKGESRILKITSSFRSVSGLKQVPEHKETGITEAIFSNSGWVVQRYELSNIKIDDLNDFEQFITQFGDEIDLKEEEKTSSSIFPQVIQ